MLRNTAVHPCAGLPGKPCGVAIGIRRERCPACSVEYTRLQGNARRREQAAILRQFRTERQP